MIDILMKMFYGGLFLGGMIGIALSIVVALIIIEIEERKEEKEV